MAAKILVNYPGSLGTDALASKKQAVADQLGVCPEDVIFVSGFTVSVVDLPDELTNAREKADKEAEKEAARVAKEQEQAEAADRKAEADAIRVLQQQAPPVRVNLPPGTPESRHKEELTEQHSTDVRRETAGDTKPTTTPAGDEKNPRRDADEKAEAAKPHAKATAKATDYDSWTLADLHAEASTRNIEGRSALDKAGLVKALQKSDKA